MDISYHFSAKGLTRLFLPYEALAGRYKHCFAKRDTPGNTRVSTEACIRAK